MTIYANISIVVFFSNKATWVCAKSSNFIAICISFYKYCRIINNVSYFFHYILSHFNSNATTGAAADFIKKYNETFDSEKEPLNQFGAAAYDCVYAIFEALKAAKAEGKNIDGSTSASEMCEILKAQFTGNFEYHGITGKPEADGKSSISWTENGFVNKEAVKYIVKEAN